MSPRRIIESLRSPGLSAGEKGVLFVFTGATLALAVVQFIGNGHP